MAWAPSSALRESYYPGLGPYSPADDAIETARGDANASASVRRKQSGDCDFLPIEVARLAARMQHDLKTPLNAVLGFSEIIRTELLGPVGHTRYREYIELIHSSGQELLQKAEMTVRAAQLISTAGRSKSWAVLDLRHELKSWQSEHKLSVPIRAPASDGPPVEIEAEQEYLHEVLSLMATCASRAIAERELAASLTIAPDHRFSLSLGPGCAVENASARALRAKPSHFPGTEDDLELCLLSALTAISNWGCEVTLARSGDILSIELSGPLLRQERLAL